MQTYAYEVAHKLKFVLCTSCFINHAHSMMRMAEKQLNKRTINLLTRFAYPMVRRANSRYRIGCVCAA